MKKYLITLLLLTFLLIPGLVMASYTSDLVPTMTSNTAPSGTVSASSVQGTGYEPWRAFDDSINTGWGSLGESGWLEYDFTTSKKIQKYTLAPQNDATLGPVRAPKNWTFEGYNSTTSSWDILDTKSNITDWTGGVKKEFTFTNNNNYLKYRINVTAIVGSGNGMIAISEMEMMEEIVTAPTAPTNLSATTGNAQVTLTWTAVTGATSYNVKRATTAGGPYTTIASSVSTATYTDTTVTNGTTYYYVVTAVDTGGESGNSNEASATPQAPQTGNKGLLVITMTNGSEKEYDLAMTEVNSFITWYNNRAGGTGTPYYIFSKTYNQGPFLSKKDYIIFDKILNFEVMEY